MKLNACLLIVTVASAMLLISMRSQTRGYFGLKENQKRLMQNLEEEYRLMLLEKAQLTNIDRIKKKASSVGMQLPDFTARRALKAK
ncbi:MAG: cell division protein FtsL [Neisseriaceae bacterium]